MLEVFKRIKEFVGKPPATPESKEWVANEMNKKDTLPVPKDGEGVTPPHPDHGAAEEAKKLGLTYFGFGRWGKNSKVTHHEVHGKLVVVEKQESKPEGSKKTDSKVTSGVKLNPAMKDKLNKAKENSPIKKLSSAEKKVKGMNEEFEEFIVENESKVDLHPSKLMKNSRGEVRTFNLRHAAASEAHTHNGVVHKLGKHYVVKIKENEDVEQNHVMVQETNRTENRRIITRSTESNGFSESSRAGVSSTSTKKITLEEIRLRQKEKLNEIDAGIEPGLSMASSGENFSRGIDRGMSTSGVKFSRDPKKKTIKELTGDETTMSIGDQKELELKRKGIDLASFKAKKFVG
jgi:hypothetical protein